MLKVVDAYPSYAEGWNYLGLIALRRGELKEALAHFEMTDKVGRTLFPERIAKKDYWGRHGTRPYMRGVRNQWSALNRLGRDAKALKIAERLDRECGDDLSAATISWPPRTARTRTSTRASGSSRATQRPS